MGSRTLMVTLLGVRAMGGSASVASERCEGGWPSGEAGDALVSSTLEEAAPVGSADMLLYTELPLSKRGRFLLPEELASSIGSLFRM